MFMDKSLIFIGLVLGLVLILTLTAVPVTTSANYIQKFSSKEDFINYLKLNPTQGGFYGDLMRTTSLGSAIQESGVVTPTQNEYSETNVQVIGVDEPDIVKTDGENIYFSSYFTTKAIKAYPIESLNLTGEIDNQGDLFLWNDTLAILSYNSVKAYDKNSLGLLWSYDVNGSIIDSRIYGDYLYLITKTWIYSYNPCPITAATGLVVKCTDIYHPIQPAPITSTYHIISIDLSSGGLKSSVSFTGSSSYSTIYMSVNNIYFTYELERNQLDNLYLSLIRDLLPSEVIIKIDTILAYDISYYSKFYEIQLVMYDYYNSLSDESRTKLLNDIDKRINDYRIEHKRDLIKTGIIKISFNNGDLTLSNVNEIPGRLLNQFSLDEYNGYLRTAVTVGVENLSNDIYVLDTGLNIVGSLIDLGLDERVYSARFVGDKGYLVTFRQTDPFFVLDLSNPITPSLKGELKIPGFSSYLHPLNDGTILGIGRENSTVKLSLFDVSNVENPTESTKYNLNDYWSEVLYNHHAFMIDKRNNLFFLPGSNGGYFFSYDNGSTLNLLKHITGVYSIRRALYINDVIYVLSDFNLTAINESSWDVISELTISNETVFITPLGV